MEKHVSPLLGEMITSVSAMSGGLLGPVPMPHLLHLQSDSSQDCIVETYTHYVHTVLIKFHALQTRLSMCLPPVHTTCVDWV